VLHAMAGACSILCTMLHCRPSNTPKIYSN
jgi:hypothetical protein